MNLVAYAARLYEDGHIPADFDPGAMLPGLVIVSPVKRPNVTKAGLIRPNNTPIAASQCLSHRVEAVSIDQPDDDVLTLSVGDIVKCREAFLDILDPYSGLLSIPTRHVIAIIQRAPPTSRASVLTLVKPSDTDDDDGSEQNGAAA